MADIKSMLIVEDEPLIAMMLEDFLDVLGISVAGAAATVSQARTLIERVPFDAAIVDVNLKAGESSEDIFTLLQDRGIPFLVSSGAPTAGPIGHPRLAKPFGLNDLERAIALLG